ncbi:MAG TPA: glycerol-3-phosphate 1-O-acyltransferase PlsY [Gemmatimonadaceae bacterium]|nr:glycerol-3-phosphate 1-O-acyltransferase PlsY [Gemmatimonadaceae bacterium]
MHPAVGVIIAYLVGSIPFAYLAGRAKGIDLRQHGSGNLGATNAMRVLGTRIGIAVYVLDTLKGMLPTLLLPFVVYTARPELWAIGFGVSAIAGHVRPIFLMGQGGGKGVATAGGVFFGLAWLPACVALAAFAVAVGITRMVSIGSMIAAIVLPLGIFFWAGPTDPRFIIAAVVGVFVIWMHRSNMQRIRNGTEPRIGARKAETASP